MPPSQAYATVIYIHIEDDKGSFSTNLVFSKSRLAPKKVMSLPRLELMAVLIGIRGLKFVLKELQLPNLKCRLWTDSQCVLQCVLHWIKAKRPLPVFVQNQIIEIKSMESVQFLYVCSQENPADLATRGNAVNIENNTLWWHGPNWLRKPQEEWKVWEFNEFIPEKGEIEEKVMYEAKLTVTEQVNSSPLKSMEGKFSSLSKLIRVTAWSHRYIRNLRQGQKQLGPLTAQEINLAKASWDSYVQKKNFPEVLKALECGLKNNLKTQLGLKLDNNGLIRCHGRMQHADLPEAARNPILLPCKDPYTKLLIQSYHEKLFHSGTSQTLARIRMEYWIPHGRAEVRKVIRKCFICLKWKGGPYKMPQMPPWPKMRVMCSPPFTYTGIDYFGPVFVKVQDGQQKVWVCLFTCLATRAIHLELLKDMSTEQFMLCLRKFIAQFGAPHQIISDNASQFKLAHSVIHKIWKKMVTDENIVS